MSECKYTVECSEIMISVADFLRDSIDVPKFLECCKACPNYEKRWACPPFDFEPVDLWRNYRTLKLFARVLRPINCTARELLAAMKDEKHCFLDELLRLEQATEGSLALSCGSCDICDVCVRNRGEKCIVPEKCRYSIEALGGDVARIAEVYFQKPLLWVSGDTAPDYMILVGGLLMQ